MICESCKCNHDGEYGSGRFCSSSCARSRGKRSKKVKDKISQSMKKREYIECVECGIVFYPQKDSTECCSIGCSMKHVWKDDTYRKHMSQVFSERATKRHEDGDTSFGWQIRDNLEPSYPESIAIRFFEENDIEFIREHKVGKYFVDFIINDIVIEIDGQQHNKPERMITDQEKDVLLKSLGYTVHRIKYPDGNIRKELKRILIAM